VEWLHSELKFLPDTMSKVGDYGAETCSEMLLHLLEQQGCDHFKAFESRSFEFPSPEDVPAPSKTVDLITKIILRNFWAWASTLSEKGRGSIGQGKNFRPASNTIISVEQYLL
jgi:hypothetical protein